MAKRYVDNSYNRSIGRVGMSVGSAVVSRSGGGSASYASYGGSNGGSYANSSRSSSSNTYVDNAFNRSAGRVGLDKGSALISKASNKSSSFANTYVDNAFNRSAGRVGLEKGTAVVSKTSDSVSKPKNYSSSADTYVDNAFNRSAGRVGLEKGTAVISKTSDSVSKPKNITSCSRLYVDNPYNRRLGRVGLPVISGKQYEKTTSIPKKSVNVYLDNALNRKLGRVGMAKGSMPIIDRTIGRVKNSMFSNPFLQFDIESTEINMIFNHLMAEKEKARNDYEYNTVCERAEGIVKRHIVANDKHSVSKHPPFEHGEIIDFTQLELGDKLGGGGFGDVHVAIWKGKYQVAVKKLRVQRVRKDKKEQFEQEVRLFSTLKHYAIVDFYGACVETPNLAIVMEFMTAGSLYDIIHIEIKQLTDEQKNQMIEDSFSALSYLHHKNIAHRDIKSRNIMVCEDLNHCKLADFGLALKDDNDSSSSVADFSVVGTYRYSPPEVLEGNRLTIEQLKAADVYSTGLTMIELIIEKEPFDGYNNNQIRKAVLEGEKPEIGSGLVSLELEELLYSCLNKSAARRPSAAHFLNCFENFF